MAHVLVAGGAGFLGAHLTRALLGRGDQVTIWDNFYTGREKNLMNLSTKIKLVRKDIREVFVDQTKVKFDLIINLACPASPPHYQRDPIYTWETSVLGTRNLLRLAADQDARFLQASTSEIYGDPQQHPQNESYWGNVNTVGLRSCYDEGKRAAETLCADYLRAKKADARLFRIFNTYGEHMHPDDGRVISNFCVAALKDRPIPVYGDGLQTRSFCYASDLIAGILALVDLPLNKYDGPINLGNPSEFTISELVSELEIVSGKKLSIKHYPLPADDPKMRRPDISRAKSVLDWQPKISLRDGLTKTYAYFAGEI